MDKAGSSHHSGAGRDYLVGLRRARLNPSERSRVKLIFKGNPFACPA